MAPPTDPHVALVLPDGRRVRLAEAVVIGRAPIPPDDWPNAVEVALAAPTVSKTHAVVGRTGDHLWIIDLASSNGSEIIDGAGAASRLVPGVRSMIPRGCRLRLGTDTVVAIERPTPTAAPHVIPAQPGRDGQPLPAASDAVDWTVVLEPPPGVPTRPQTPPSEGGGATSGDATHGAVSRGRFAPQQSPGVFYARHHPGASSATGFGRHP